MNEATATEIRLSAIEKRCDKKEGTTTDNSIAIAKLQSDTINLKEWMTEYEQKFNDRVNQVALIQVRTDNLIVDKKDNKEKLNNIYKSIATLDAFKNKQTGYMALLVVIISLVWDAIKSRVIP